MLAWIPIPESRDIIEATADHAKIDYGEHNKEIEKVICAAIQEITEEIAKEKPQFKVSEILKVGGFNEGTKIINPDEFDYLVVLEHMSEPGLFLVEHDEETPGIVRLKINEPYNQDEKWKHFIKDGYLRCMQLDEQHKNDARNRLYENFGIEVIKAIYRLNKGKGRSGMRFLTELNYNDWPKAFTRFAREIDKAWIKAVDVKHPNVLLTFIIENRIVEVDLTPAIRYENVQVCFQPEYCPYPKLAESVLNRRSILFVGQLDNTFRITFTETEVDYLNNVMSLKHRKVYMYLKYISHLVDNKVYSSIFPSYTLKLACMQHDLQCERNGDRFLPCLSDILFIYDYACHTVSLPSVFNRRLDVMSGSYKFRMIYKKRLRVLSYLRKIPELVTKSSSRRQHMEELNELFDECRESMDFMQIELKQDKFVEVLYSRKDWLIY